MHQIFPIAAPFATPSSSSGRAAGKIFVGLVQDDGTLDWKYNYSINGSAYYAYSCLTILPDGTIGLLYESDGTVITYEDFDIEDDGVANKIAVLPSILFG